MTIEVNLKNGNNYIFENVSKYSDLSWDPKWFWVEWAKDGSRRYIATSEILDVLFHDSEVTK